MAFASSNDLGEKALEDAIGRAIAFARITTADPNNVLPEDKGVAEVAGLYDPEIAAIPMDRKIELAKTVEKLALKDPRITKSDGASYQEAEGEITIANSNGLLKSYKSGGCGFGVSVVAEKGDQKSSGGESCCAAVLRRPQAGRGGRREGGARRLRDARPPAGQDAAGAGHLHA